MKFKEYFRTLLIITQFIIFQCLFFYSLESNVNESSLNNMLDLCELQLTDKVCCGDKFDGKWVKPPLPASILECWLVFWMVCFQFKSLLMCLASQGWWLKCLSPSHLCGKPGRSFWLLDQPSFCGPEGNDSAHGRALSLFHSNKFL